MYTVIMICHNISAAHFVRTYKALPEAGVVNIIHGVGNVLYQVQEQLRVSPPLWGEGGGLGQQGSHYGNTSTGCHDMMWL